MFEQFSTVAKHTSPWAVMLSFTTQAAVAGSVVLISIIQFQQLDLSALVLQPPPLFAPSPLRDPVRIVAVERSGSTPHFTVASPSRVFTAPSRIPDGVHYIDDTGKGPAVSMSDLLSYPTGAPSASSTGVPFGTAQASVAAPPPPAPKPAARTQEAAPVRVSGGVLEAMIIRRVTPVYPPIARQMRISGTVRMVGVIGKDGTVQNLQTVDGHPLLVEAARDAVRQWLYRPTLLSGQPVPVIAPIEVRFILQ